MKDIKLGFYGDLLENRQFEKYLDAYTDSWEKQDKQKQLKKLGLKDSEIGEAPSTTISMDDIGGRQAVSRKSPEA